MYCCGPTVYDFAHIGNWRTFVFADLVRRYLEFKNFQVTHVMNITDIEDKIIKGVRENKTTLREFTGKFETAFLDDLKALNCQEPQVKPRATECIKQIIELIEKLIARGIADWAKAMFSCTVRLNSRLSCRTTPMCRRSQAGSTWLKSAPSNRTWPSFGR